MLSSDHSEPRVAQRRRRAGRAGRRARTAAVGGSRSGAPCDEAQSFNPSEPWDVHAAEALTRLYESEEGKLWKPAAATRPPPLDADSDADEPAMEPQADDRAWLEAHLSHLVERLQHVLAQSSPDHAFAALNGRLEAIEQRFAAALGRVAQRADMDSLRSIEAHVLELATQLEHARDRLDEIGAVDDEVRALARKLDETGAQRAGALEKLVRDSIAEWREGEERTTSALQSLEEAVNRLVDTMDAMEALKPAPDLSVPALSGPELAGTAGITAAGLHAEGMQPSVPAPFATLDAADYAPDAIPEGPLPAAHEALQPGSVEWPARPADGDPGQHAGARLTPGALRIMAMRAKLRRSSAAGPDTVARVPQMPDELAAPGTFRHASFSLLLMAGAAVLAGSTYFLYQSVLPPLTRPAPVMLAPDPHPTGIKSDLADPTSRQRPG
jgi:hypothetical protein